MADEIKKPTLTIRELREYLDCCETAALEDVEPPMTKAEFDAMPICVRVDDDGLHVGGLASVQLEDDHTGENTMLVLDAEHTADPAFTDCDPLKRASAEQLTNAIATGTLARMGKLTERGAIAVATTLVMRLRERFTNCENDADEQLRSDVDAIVPTLQRMAGLAS